MSTHNILYFMTKSENFPKNLYIFVALSYWKQIEFPRDLKRVEIEISVFELLKLYCI